MPSDRIPRSSDRTGSARKPVPSTRRFRQFASATARDLPRWIFLAALIYAPWDYGGTTDSSVTRINWLLGIAVGLWCLERAIRARKPALPIGLIVPSALILILGWLATLNAHAIYDTELQVFAPLRTYLSVPLSSVDGGISAAWMVRISLLLGSSLVVADLARRPEWLLRIWMSVGIAGGSIALLGLAQKATGAVLPFWEFQPWEINSFFATYYYHGNAGAFFNLVLPPTAGLALRAFHRPDLRVQRAIWLAATVLIIGAAFTNTSRAAQFIGLVAMGALTVVTTRRLWRTTISANRVILLSTVVGVIAILFAIVQASGIAEENSRWRQATREIPNDLRWQVYKVALGSLPDAGWMGFGPGTFALIFPQYWRFPAETYGHWESLHEDYLQTVIEWGWGGAACWAAIFFGGFAAGFIGLNRHRRAKTPNRLSRIMPVVLIALGTVALHSLVDFPLQVESLQLYTGAYLGICWASAGSARSR